MNLKKMLTAICASCALVTGAIASGGNFPTKPISLVVVWPAGGGHDLAARLIAEDLSKTMGVPVVVNNVTGSAGSNGMRHVANADPDGYTIGLMGMHALTQSYMNPNATSLDNIEPLVYISPDPGALQVRTDSGIDSVAQFIDQLKQKPRSVIHGNDSLGGNTAIFAAQLEHTFDIKLARVPYAGHAPNVAALVSGEVISSSLPVPQVADHHRSGTIKVLGVMAEERHFMLPDVPTFKEQGYDLVSGDYYMLFMPKGIAEQHSAILEKSLLAVLQDPDFQSRAKTLGLTVQPHGMAETKLILEQQIETIYPVLDSLGLVHTSLKR